MVMTIPHLVGKRKKVAMTIPLLFYAPARDGQNDHVKAVLGNDEIVAIVIPIPLREGRDSGHDHSRSFLERGGGGGHGHAVSSSRKKGRVTMTIASPVWESSRWWSWPSHVTL